MDVRPHLSQLPQGPHPGHVSQTMVGMRRNQQADLHATACRHHQCRHQCLVGHEVRRHGQQPPLGMEGSRQQQRIERIVKQIRATGQQLRHQRPRIQQSPIHRHSVFRRHGGRHIASMSRIRSRPF